MYACSFFFFFFHSFFRLCMWVNECVWALECIFLRWANTILAMHAVPLIWIHMNYSDHFVYEWMNENKRKKCDQILKIEAVKHTHTVNDIQANIIAKSWTVFCWPTTKLSTLHYVNSCLLVELMHHGTMHLANAHLMWKKKKNKSRSHYMHVCTVYAVIVPFSITWKFPPHQRENINLKFLFVQLSLANTFPINKNFQFSVRQTTATPYIQYPIESVRTPKFFSSMLVSRDNSHNGACVCVFFHSFYFNTNTIYTLWLWSKSYERKRALTLVHTTPWNASLCVCLLVHWCVCAKHTKTKWKKKIVCFSSLFFEKEFSEIGTHSFGACSILLCAGWLRQQFNHQPKSVAAVDAAAAGYCRGSFCVFKTNASKNRSATRAFLYARLCRK